MENKKQNIIEFNTIDFYKYILKKIEADMLEKNLNSFKLRNLKESNYFISQTTYNNIKSLANGNNIPLISNPTIDSICKKLKIKLERKYNIIL